nr:MAG TPA: hypothetical protein [Bacteriophage sp.]DAR18241.1 MAG TPA: hypothetical protein [Bacteriophage sp.]
MQLQNGKYLRRSGLVAQTIFERLFPGCNAKFHGHKCLESFQPPFLVRRCDAS